MILTANGGEVRKVMWAGRRGAPDLRVMHPKMTCWVEMKAPTGFLSIVQKVEHAKMQSYNENIFVISSIGDLLAFLALLEIEL